MTKKPKRRRRPRVWIDYNPWYAFVEGSREWYMRRAGRTPWSNP